VHGDREGLTDVQVDFIVHVIDDYLASAMKNCHVYFPLLLALQTGPTKL